MYGLNNNETFLYAYIGKSNQAMKFVMFQKCKLYYIKRADDIFSNNEVDK